MKAITIDFEGTSVPARYGESLAAALIANGVRHFRETSSGACRGLFCGMGVCQECLVEVDGRPNQRACMTKVLGPMAVKRMIGNAPLPLNVPLADPVQPLPVRTPQVLVIGAGPGGLSAALAARRAGAEVVVVDERSLAGGQYYKQLSVEGPDIAPADRQHRDGARLIDQVRQAGVELIGDAVVWGAFEPGEYGIVIDGHSQRWRPHCTVIATGAYERGWPVSGWTLPGVMTTGAAQTLWRTARRLPGKRVLIAGNGPLNLQLAAELSVGGAQVLAVVEAAPAPDMADVGVLTRMTMAAPGLMLDGLRYRLALWRAGGRLLNEAVVSSIEPHGEGLRAHLSRTDGSALDESFDIDCVCLGYGFEPSNELLRALGCTHDYDAERRQLITRRDARGQTDIDRVFALGDCTGLGGAKAALAEGTIVGLEAAMSCGYTPSPDLQLLRRDADVELARQLGFQKALWTLYQAAPTPPSAADCLICRCEEVSFATLQTALDESLSTVGAIKRRTRIGMGRCQGRYCAPVLDARVSGLAQRERDEMSGFAPRVPIKPVTIAELAGIVEKQS